ncbi:MAG: SDR family oxidoreductase [Chloroflexi bacterium]|nr:SDR family oxidoreductase [Chloroflexota bacterium]
MKVSEENMYSEKAQKIAIVVGVENEIGSTCALTLQRAGHIVIMVGEKGARTPIRADSSFETTTDTLPLFSAQRLNPAMCDEILSTVHEYGGFAQILVNCRNQCSLTSAVDTELQNLEEAFSENVNDAFFMSQAFAKDIIFSNTGAHGTIVNLTSIFSSHAAANMSAYAASKAALESITKSLALEWGQYNIRVNGVASIEPPFRLNRREAFETEKLASRIPYQHQLVQVNEVVNAILYLCSDASRGITGQILTVDNGFTVNGNWK